MLLQITTLLLSDKYTSPHGYGAETSGVLESSYSEKRN